MIKLAVIVCAIMLTTSDAGTEAQRKDCENTCDTHYSKMLHECNRVAECEVYVRRDHRACYNECAEEQK